MQNIKALNGRELAEAITQAQADASLYERLKASAKLLAALQAEQQGRNAAAEQAKVDAWEREVGRWTVESVTRTSTQIEGPLQSHTVAALLDGVRTTHSLNGCERSLCVAVARSGKLPLYILALGDTPEAALERWLMSMRRGYMVG